MYVSAVQPTFSKYRLCSSADRSDRLNLAPRIASLISWRTELRSRLFSRLYLNKSQGRPGSLGIQYIWVFNFRYTVFLCLQLGKKYSLTTNFGYKVYPQFFVILVFYMRFSVIFGIYWKVYFGYFGIIPLLPLADPEKQQWHPRNEAVARYKSW